MLRPAYEVYKSAACRSGSPAEARGLCPSRSAASAPAPDSAPSAPLLGAGPTQWNGRPLVSHFTFSSPPSLPPLPCSFPYPSLLLPSPLPSPPFLPAPVTPAFPPCGVARRSPEACSIDSARSPRRLRKCPCMSLPSVVKILICEDGPSFEGHVEVERKQQF